MVTVARKAAGQTCFFGVFLKRLAAELRRDLAKDVVAGVGEAVLEVDRAVDAFADDLLTAEDVRAAALKAPCADVRYVLNRGSGGQHLEDRARCVGHIEEAVEIDTGICTRRVAFHVRHVVGVIARRGDGAEDLTCLVVVDADRPAAACQRLQSGVLHLGADGERRGAVLLAERVQAVYLVIADHLVGVGTEQRRVDIAVAVAEQMHRGRARLRIVCVDTSGGRVQQARVASVIHVADAQIRAGVDVRAPGKGHPIVCLCKIGDAEHDRAE